MEKQQLLPLGNLMESPDSIEPKENTKRVQGGVATTNLVFSAYQSDNAEVFPKIMALHVENNALVADVTYGKGVFWKYVPKNQYRTITSDAHVAIANIQSDCRSLPYKSQSLNCVVLDPPTWKVY